jgi:hypothetical protein
VNGWCNNLSSWALKTIGPSNHACLAAGRHWKTQYLQIWALRTIGPSNRILEIHSGSRGMVDAATMDDATICPTGH